MPLTIIDLYKNRIIWTVNLAQLLTTMFLNKVKIRILHAPSVKISTFAKKSHLRLHIRAHHMMTGN